MRLVDTWDDLMESASTIMGNIPDFPKQLSNNWIAPELLDVNKKCVHVSEMQIDNFYIFCIQYWFIFLEHNDINHLKNLVRYCDFIPKSIGNRMVLQSTPNGNCIFNAISILMYGNESMAMMLKVAAVANMVDQLIPFTKYVRLLCKINWILQQLKMKHEQEMFVKHFCPPLLSCTYTCIIRCTCLY